MPPGDGEHLLRELARLERRVDAVARQASSQGKGLRQLAARLAALEGLAQTGKNICGSNQNGVGG